MESPLIVINRGTKAVGHVVGGLAVYTKCKVRWASGEVETIDPARNQDKYMVCLDVSPEARAVLEPEKIRSEFEEDPGSVFLSFLEKRRKNSEYVSGEDFLHQFNHSFDKVIPSDLVSKSWAAVKKTWDKGKDVHLTKKSGKWNYKSKQTWTPTFLVDVEDGQAAPVIQEHIVTNAGKKAILTTAIESIYTNAVAKFQANPLGTLKAFEELLSKRAGREDFIEVLLDDKTRSKERSLFKLIVLGVNEIKDETREPLSSLELKFLEQMLDALAEEIREDRNSAVRQNPLVLAIALNAYEEYDIRVLGYRANLTLASLVKARRKAKSQINLLVFNALSELQKAKKDLEEWEKTLLLDALGNLEFAQPEEHRERLTIQALEFGFISFKREQTLKGLHLASLLEIKNRKFISALVTDAPEAVFEICKQNIGMTMTPSLLSKLLVADDWFIEFADKHGLTAMLQASVQSLAKTDSFQGKLLQDALSQKLAADAESVAAKAAMAKEDLDKQVTHLRNTLNKVEVEKDKATQQLKASLERFESQVRDHSAAVGLNTARALAKSLSEVQSNGANLSVDQLFGRLQAYAAGSGIAVIGEPGETLTYEPKLHESAGGDLEPGSQVQVLYSGYTWLLSGEVNVLMKAKVTPIDL